MARKPTTHFTDILLKISKSAREAGDRKRRSFEWYRSHAREIRAEARSVKKEDIDTNAIMKEKPELLKARRTSKSMIGSMFMFYYDPKWKKKLPYYDTFPLVMPFSFEKDRFTAINFHYLPPISRAILMGHLYSLLEDERDGEKRIALSYGILKSASKYKLFKPCIKTYLISHVKSKLRKIDPKEWDLSLSLPLAQFEKASETKVWADSIKMVNEATKTTQKTKDKKSK